jgi:hypothetical protein
VFRATLFIANRFTPVSSLDAASGLFTETINCRHRFQQEGQMNSRRFFTLVITLVWIGIAVTRAMAQEITVAQAVVCQEIVDRMPVGAGDVIPAGTDRVFCFTRIDGIPGGGRDYPQLVLQGSLKASVVLPVRASWRTWSSKTLLPEWTGEWMVEVLSNDGTPLESIIFSFSRPAGRLIAIGVGQSFVQHGHVAVKPGASIGKEIPHPVTADMVKLFSRQIGHDDA